MFIGSPAFFYVDAEPWQYLIYQWYLNSKPIPGATSDSLRINSVTKTQAGVYKCAVSSGGPSVMSQGALLTIVTPITIKKQPSSITVKTGKKALFKVLVAGTPPFHYQWYNGTNTEHHFRSHECVIHDSKSSSFQCWILLGRR